MLFVLFIDTPFQDELYLVLDTKMILMQGTYHKKGGTVFDSPPEKFICSK